MKRDNVAPRNGASIEWAQRLFRELQEAGIPISLSVPFLVRARGWQIAEFCDELEIHRGYFSALLKGQYLASMSIRLGVRQRLGFDPWRNAAGAPADLLDHSIPPGDHTRPQSEGAAP
ncbi:MAG: hypothetical protein OSA97_14430 [Nevskia sp.]|nr:hypothetical protein [Nevskia sp.]